MKSRKEECTVYLDELAHKYDKLKHHYVQSREELKEKE